MSPHQTPAAGTPRNSTETVTDSLGRVLTLRVLSPADMLDLIEAAGSASSNPVWMNYAIVIAHAAAIDGLPLPLPNTKAQIRDLSRRLGNEGFVALAGQSATSSAQAENPADTELATAKN